MHKTADLPENFSNVVLIGSGGMAAVYRADDESMQRVVAIKVMTAQTLNAQELKRFSAEAKAMSKLEHPNIIRVFSFGQLSNTQPYMVLEYVDGESLDKIIKRGGKLSLERALPLFKQLASALACAHQQSIVHRDVKPGNVLISREVGSGGECAKLADFGIARDMMRTTQATAPGTMFCSPAYASPEQCAGEQVDARSDIYSLGCLMYEVLAGRPPFQADDVVALVMKHYSEAPELIADISPGLNRIVQRCLAKKMEQRFADGDALLKALDEGDTTFDRGTAFGGADSTRSRPKIQGLTVAVALTVLTLVGGGVYLWVDKLEKDKASGAAAILRKTPGMIIDEAVGIRENQGETKEKSAKAARLLESIRNVADDSDPRMARNIHYQLGHCYMGMGDLAAAEAEFRLARRFTEKRHDLNDWDPGNGLATALMQEGRWSEAESIWTDMIDKKQGDAGFFMFSHFQLGRIMEHKKQYRKAIENYQFAIDHYTPNTWTEKQNIPPQAKEAIARIEKEHPELKSTVSPSK